MKHVLLALILPVALVAPALGKDRFLDQLTKTARKAARQLAPSLRGKICVLDMADGGDRNKSSELGQKFSELLAAELVRFGPEKYTVVSRQELEVIARDTLLLTGDDEQIIDSLRKNAGTDMFVSGSYTAAGDVLSITLRAVEAKTSAVAAAATVSIKATDAAAKMLARQFNLETIKVSKPPTEESSPAPAPVVAPDSESKAGLAEVLDLDLGIFYEGADARLYPVREGMVLNSKDNYAIYVKPRSKCHLYVYQVDSRNSATRLFPNPDYTFLQNPMSSRELWIPDEKGYLFLDENRGREEIYVFATKEASPSLMNLKDFTRQDINAAIRTMGVGGRRGSLVQSRSLVRGTQGNAMDLLTRKLTYQGDFYYHLAFIHQ